MFDTIVNISIDASTGYTKNMNLIYTSYPYDLVNRMINYKCILINNELLKNAFPDLTASEINILLTNNDRDFVNF
jgi:hypothetical protein